MRLRSLMQSQTAPIPILEAFDSPSEESWSPETHSAFRRVAKMFIPPGNRDANSPHVAGRHFVLLVSLLATALMLASPARGQNGVQFKKWKPSLNEGAATKPKMDCNSLISLTGYEFSIETAALIPAAGEIPEYCHVTGQILPEVRFELSLPTSWNNRFYMFGNGGYAGESLSSPPRVNTRNSGLRKGFAVAQTNTGHDAAIEPLGSFALSRQKLLDYAWRAVHVTAETSKRIIRTYYGNVPGRSYFDGCSTGGRQGLMSAQRFPDDFDGIVVGAPVLNFSGTVTRERSSSRSRAAATAVTTSAPVPYGIRPSLVTPACANDSFRRW